MDIRSNDNDQTKIRVGRKSPKDAFRPPISGCAAAVASGLTANVSMIILFLDFDGVLHPFPLGPDEQHFSATESLWTLLDRIASLHVVITSTWRERFTLPELIALLAAHGGERFASRFIGTTPILEDASSYVPGVRQREVEAWLAANSSLEASYIIVDDIEEYFDRDCGELYLVDGTTGLVESDVDAVLQWIKLRSTG